MSFASSFQWRHMRVTEMVFISLSFGIITLKDLKTMLTALLSRQPLLAAPCLSPADSPCPPSCLLIIKKKWIQKQVMPNTAAPHWPTAGPGSRGPHPAVPVPQCPKVWHIPGESGAQPAWVPPATWAPRASLKVNLVDVLWYLICWLRPPSCEVITQIQRDYDERIMSSAVFPVLG